MTLSETIKTIFSRVEPQLYMYINILTILNFQIIETNPDSKCVFYIVIEAEIKEVLCMLFDI